MYNKYIRVALISESSSYRVCSQTLKERVEFYMCMYCLIIESDFVSTSDSFNNRVAYEPSFVEPSLDKLTSSFVRLQS
jgi:hypothetical protein